MSTIEKLDLLAISDILAHLKIIPTYSYIEINEIIATKKFPYHILLDNYNMLKELKV